MEDRRGLHWLQQALLPSLVLVEGEEYESVASACSKLNPASAGSLLRLLDSRRGSRRTIEYLTPSAKLSQAFKFRVCAPTELILDRGLSRSIDNALYQIVASHKPDRSRVEGTPFPWFVAFRRTLFTATNTWRAIAEDTGSTLHLPLCILFAVSATESDPVARLIELIRKQDAIPGVPRLMVLVRDESCDDMQCELAEGQVRTQFGTEFVCTLRLDTEETFDESYYDILSRVVKATQKRIFSLHDTVSGQRKGISGTFRSLFGGGSGASSVSRNNPDDSESPSHKVRTLADLLFWMGNYDAALTNYSYLRDDYQRDESHIQLANALEMIAICSFLAKGSPQVVPIDEGAKRVDLIDKAVESFIRSVPIDQRIAGQQTGLNAKKQTPLGLRLATRAAILLLDVAPQNGHALIKVLAKPLAYEDNLCAAILQEQIGQIYTQQGLAKRGLFRRYSFNVLLAASLYRTIGLDAHSWRCYKVVYSNMSKKGWPAAEHHLEVSLGNLARNLGDSEGIIEFRGRCLERGYEIVLPVPISAQHSVSPHFSFLNELLDTLRASPGSDRNLPFELPRVAHFEQPHFHLGLSDEARFRDALIWQEIEGRLFKLVPPKRRGTPFLSTTKDMVTAYLNESMFVRITFQNPLSCELKMFGVTLTGEGVDGAAVQAIEETEVTLGPKAKVSVDLRIVPTVPGIINIVAVKWSPIQEKSRGCVRRLPIPIQVNAFPQAAFLFPRLLGNDDEGFQLELTNRGGAPSTPSGRLLICCSKIASAEFSLAGTTSSLIDEEGYVQSLSIASGIVPGDCMVLQCIVPKIRSRPILCAVMFDESRICRFIIPPSVAASPSCDTEIKASATIKSTSSGDRLVVVNMESEGQLFRPVTLFSLGVDWTIETATPGLDHTSSPFAQKWSLVARLVKSEGMNQGRIPYDDANPLGELLSPQDFILRSFHAKKFFEERAQLKKQLERERAALEAQGQLPVTIQDVRRARQRGLNVPTSLPQFVEGANDTVVLERNLLHLAIDCIFESTYDHNEVRKVFVPRVINEEALLSLKFLGQGQRNGVIREGEATYSLPLSIRIENLSTTQTLREVFFCVNQTTVANDGFPRPLFWSGKTRCTFAELEPLQTVDVDVVAHFASAGVFSLKSIHADFIDCQNKSYSEDVEGDCYVVIVRSYNAGDESLFREVDMELL